MKSGARIIFPWAPILLISGCCSGLGGIGDGGGGGAVSVPHGLSSTEDGYCLTCHRDGIGGAVKTTHPGLAGCVSCHKPSGAGITIPHEISFPNDAYCLGCHQNGESGAKKTPHPGLTGCVSCHVAGSGGDGGFPMPPSAPHGASSNTDGYCLFCHKDGKAGAPATSHHDRGGCASCHATTIGPPPTGPSAPHRAAATNDPYCLECHRDGFGGAKKTLHPDMQGCASCHKTAGLPPGGPEVPHDVTSSSDGYCLGCHKDGVGSAPKTTHPGKAGCTLCHIASD